MSAERSAIGGCVGGCGALLSRRAAFAMTSDFCDVSAELPDTVGRRSDCRQTVGLPTTSISIRRCHPDIIYQGFCFLSPDDSCSLYTCFNHPSKLTISDSSSRKRTFADRNNFGYFIVRNFVPHTTFLEFQKL